MRGYDEWKLMTPRLCELKEESGGCCPWEESEPDPDELRDLRNEP